MGEAIAFLFGILTGIGCWYYCDLKDSPYDRGYRDGYLRGKHEKAERKEE
jgi:hypothetical protein